MPIGELVAKMQPSQTRWLREALEVELEKERSGSEEEGSESGAQN